MLYVIVSGEATDPPRWSNSDLILSFLLYHLISQPQNSSTTLTLIPLNPFIYFYIHKYTHRLKTSSSCLCVTWVSLPQAVVVVTYVRPSSLLSGPPFPLCVLRYRVVRRAAGRGVCVCGVCKCVKVVYDLIRVPWREKKHSVNCHLRDIKELGLKACVCERRPD